MGYCLLDMIDLVDCNRLGVGQAKDKATKTNLARKDKGHQQKTMNADREKTSKTMRC